MTSELIRRFKQVCELDNTADHNCAAEGGEARGQFLRSWLLGAGVAVDVVGNTTRLIPDVVTQAYPADVHHDRFAGSQNGWISSEAERALAGCGGVFVARAQIPNFSAVHRLIRHLSN